jgi:hypothetical protein
VARPFSFLNQKAAVPSAGAHHPTLCRTIPGMVFFCHGLTVTNRIQKFISLEGDIENALPKFQELIVSLKYVGLSS